MSYEACVVSIEIYSKLLHVRVTNDDSLFFKDVYPIETRVQVAVLSTRKRFNSQRFKNEALVASTRILGSVTSLHVLFPYSNKGQKST